MRAARWRLPRYLMPCARYKSRTRCACAALRRFHNIARICLTAPACRASLRWRAHINALAARCARSRSSAAAHAHRAARSALPLSSIALQHFGSIGLRTHTLARVAARALPAARHHAHALRLRLITRCAPYLYRRALPCLARALSSIHALALYSRRRYRTAPSCCLWMVGDRLLPHRARARCSRAAAARASLALPAPRCRAHINSTRRRTRWRVPRACARSARIALYAHRTRCLPSRTTHFSTTTHTWHLPCTHHLARAAPAATYHSALHTALFVTLRYILNAVLTHRSYVYHVRAPRRQRHGDAGSVRCAMTRP